MKNFDARLYPVTRAEYEAVLERLAARWESPTPEGLRHHLGVVRLARAREAMHRACADSSSAAARKDHAAWRAAQDRFDRALRDHEKFLDIAYPKEVVPMG